MNEKHMQYILAVLKEGSFTAAAKRLYVSQPSLSQAVKAAEASLGTAIFDRSTEPVSLTPAGELYVNTARQILDLSANLKKQVEELSREESGSLRLGISVQRAMELLPLLYPKFKKQFPHVALELMEHGSALLEQTVLEGTVDIALLTTFPRHEGLVYELLKEEHLVLLVNKDCSLASRIPPGTPIDIREAANEEFICSRRGHSVRAILNSLFLERGIAPKLALETISIEVGKHMTRPWQWMIGTSDGNFVHMIAVGKVCRILEKKEVCPRRKYLETKWVPIEEVLEYDLETNLIHNMKLFIAYYRDRKQHELPVFVKDDGDLQSIFEYRPPKSKQIKRFV